jgi:hypothetical protein
MSVYFIAIGYFKAIWCICCHYFMVIWYVFYHFGVLYQENLATQIWTRIHIEPLTTFLGIILAVTRHLFGGKPSCPNLSRKVLCRVVRA